MNELAFNEQTIATAFNRQSLLFDALYASNAIIQYKRARVRKLVLQQLKEESNILELNAGTGEDAIFFAQHNHRVHATDISEGMQKILIDKIKKYQLQNNITYELCSFTSLEKLQRKEPYDLIFSNFAGLNCTGKLDKVLSDFSPLLKPGGIAILVLMPPFCLWEFLLLFKGKWKTSIRRFAGKSGARAHIEGTHFKCWYYRSSFVINQLKADFDLLKVEGLCTIVPPSYFENFPQKHPKLYRFLQEKENKLKDKWPWKYTGDYFIISLKRKTCERHAKKSLRKTEKDG